MADENVKPDPIDNELLTAERERVGAIVEASKEHPDIQAQAIKDGWSIKATQLAVLRADRPRVNARQPIASAHANTPDVIAAAIMLHSGDRSAAERHYGPVVAEQAERMRCRTLLDVIENANRMEGRDPTSNQNRLVASAFSTLSMPIALGDFASKIELDSYRQTPQSWRAFSRIVATKDFKPNKLLRLNLGREFDRVAPGGELHHGTVGEQSFEVSADTFAMMLSVDRRDLVNDDLSLLSGIAKNLGQAGARAVNDGVYRTILTNDDPDGDPFFDAANSNLLTGAGTALSMSSLQTGVANMMARVDVEGRCIDLAARVLLVPATLDVTARECLISQSLARYTAVGIDRQPEGNPLYQSLSLAVEPRLSNATFTGNSAIAWYLFSAPADSGIVVAFLGGNDFPIVEHLPAGPEVLGWTWRSYIDFGVALADPRACLKCAGA